MRDEAKANFLGNSYSFMWEYRKLRRPFDKHLDNRELNSLVPWPSETAHELHELSADAVREATDHVVSCADCSRKVWKYQQLVNGLSSGAIPEAATPGTDCPKGSDVDWYEVAGGLLSEGEASHFIMHAALCDHCGPLLRAASVDDNPLHQDSLLLEWKAPSRPNRIGSPRWLFPRWPLLWLIPTAALVLIVGVLSMRPSSLSTALSGPKFAEFAVSTYRQHAQGSLALDLLSDSQQSLNEWFKAKLPFSLALPASPAVPGEERPYRLQGARLLQVSGKTTAVYVAYQMQKGAAGLIITPSSVASASGGVEVDFKKVSFHYAMVEGYKVVTWSAHGLTYALVSQEGNDTQRSCMVCHSAMRDRDLSHTPTPLSQHFPGTL
jgi:anti-sigma factor RsiW